MNQTREPTREKRKRSDKRKATSRITLRFLPDEMEHLRAGVAKTTEPWRGISYHLRSALILWATAMRSPLADARMRPVGKRRTKGKAKAKAA